MSDPYRKEVHTIGRLSMKDKNNVELLSGDNVLTWHPDDRHSDIIGKIQSVDNTPGAEFAYVIFGAFKPRKQVRYPWEMIKVGVSNALPENIPAVKAPSPMASVVNNHVCPTCKNNRCSRSERICWRCGGAL